ncbi:MAG: LacI family DNA-binding transcriptional regulator [Opitutales bacterium]|nr:LacI family DNA-binding transcriptional regulator [Opitutales bacterium]
MTIEEVAKLAGVSVATVSNVINGKPKASASTVMKVNRAMEAANYKPRPLDRRPGRRRVKSVGDQALQRFTLIFGNCTLPDFQIPLYSNLITAINNAAYRKGVTMVLCRVPPGGKVPPDVLSDGGDGVIVVRHEMVPELYSTLGHLPKVGVLGDYCADMDIVSVNNDRIGFKAFEYLNSLGLKDFACICDSVHRAQRMRARAFRNAAERAGAEAIIEQGKNLILSSRNRVEPNYAAISDLLEKVSARARRPFGLFCPTDLMATAVYPCMRRRSLEAGKDFMMISCNYEVPYLAGMDPRPAEIDLNLDTIGDRALDLLLWRCRNPSEPLSVVLVDPRLIKDGSGEGFQ